VAQTVFGVGMTIEEPNDLSMRMRERLASAVHAARRQLAIGIPEFSLYVWIRPVLAPKLHVTAAREVVLEFSLASMWRYAIWCGVLQVGDILFGRFPRLDPNALPVWADAMWRLSVEGRLAALAVRMPLEVGGLTSQEWPTSIEARRNELLGAVESCSDHATASRLVERSWAVPLTWQALCAMAEAEHLATPRDSPSPAVLSEPDGTMGGREVMISPPRAYTR
jgi:hypothetical protein